MVKCISSGVGIEFLCNI